MKKVVATQCESPGILFDNIQSFSAKISDTSCKLCFDGTKIASGFGKHLGEVDMFGWEGPPTLKYKMKQVSRELETIEKMKACVCHMEDKDKTYVNDLLSGDKNRMSENVMSAITSLSLKIRTTAPYSVENNACPRACEVRSRHYIFHSEVGGARTPWPPPLGSATVIWLCHSLLKPISKCNPCKNLSYRLLIWPCVKYHIANRKGEYNARVYVTPQWYTTDIGFLPPLPGFFYYQIWRYLCLPVIKECNNCSCLAIVLAFLNIKGEVFLAISL